MHRMFQNNQSDSFGVTARSFANRAEALSAVIEQFP